MSDFGRDTAENFQGLREELKALRAEQQKATARIIELLSSLVGKDPREG